MSSGEIAGLIKRLAVDAVDAEKPADIVFGSVVSTTPLQIRTDQKLVLEESCLVLTRAVSEYTLDVSVSAATSTEAAYSLVHSHGYSGDTELAYQEDLPSHAHSYSGKTDSWGYTVPEHSHVVSGKKKIVMHNGLKVGENVILLRLRGGQRFLVLDRVNEPSTEGEWIK